MEVVDELLAEFPESGTTPQTILWGHVNTHVGPSFGAPTPMLMLRGVVAAGVFLAVFDVLFAMRTKARWFAIHAIANAMVVIFGFGDLVRCVLDPMYAASGDYNCIPFYFIVSVHMYHMIAFSNLKVADWVHHIIFAGLVCAFALGDQYGPVQNTVGFFLSGLPGGIDYCMMFCVRHGWMEINTEKRYNARIMTWLRSPGCLLSAFMLYNAALHPERATFTAGWTRYTTCITAILCFINGVYYQQQVVLSCGRKEKEYSC